MTIYEIEAAILDCVDEETGDIVDVEKLEALEMELDEKISNIACWIKNLDAEAEAIKAERLNLEKRQKADENKSKSLKSFLQYILNGKKFRNEKCIVSYRHNKKVLIDDDAVEKLPEEFQKITIEPRKKELAEAMKLGFEFEGAELVDSVSVVIR